MLESEAPETEREIMRRGAAILANRLPLGWSTQLIAPDFEQRLDGLVKILSPGGESATLVAEAKTTVEGRDVASIANRLERYIQTQFNAGGLLFARYLSAPVRMKLAKATLSYVDATGNLRVELSSPGLYVSDRGADRDPWRGPGRPLGTLKGAPAARIVRAFADFATPWKIRDLINVANVSTGAAYRVVDYLDREGLAVREPDGRISIPDWVALLRRWSDDYGFVRNSRVTRWIAPRGLPDLLNRIAEDGERTNYVVTGTLAAAEWAPLAPARSAMIYVADAAEAGTRWDLRPVDGGANALLAEPDFDVVFERPLKNQQGVMVATSTQVVVDLMTGPGRNPSEAEELLNWMQRSEHSWRL